MSFLKEFIEKSESKIHIPWTLTRGCCSVELENVASSTYEWRRLGIENSADHPSQADTLIVAGWINSDFAEELKEAYAQLSGVRAVIAVGTCALSGAPYKLSGEKVIAVSDILPVDVFVPGCPPRPEAILEAIQTLKNKRKPIVDQKKVIYEALKGPSGR